ncbi:hypothetical protein ABBQ32_008550 [Trebouxia sp. C0010 RCD-2024]
MWRKGLTHRSQQDIWTCQSLHTFLCCGQQQDETQCYTRKHDQGSMDEQRPSKKARTDAAVVDREEVAKRANRKLPLPSSYGKPNGEDGWTDRRLQDLQEFMCLLCS